MESLTQTVSDNFPCYVLDNALTAETTNVLASAGTENPAVHIRRGFKKDAAFYATHAAFYMNHKIVEIDAPLLLNGCQPL